VFSNARQIFSCQRSRLLQQSVGGPDNIRPLQTAEVFVVVGPDGIEPSTSPLSGVRSSHLSYGPGLPPAWWSWSGSNRRPPECKSGALPTELQPLIENLIEASWMQRSGDQPPTASEKLSYSPSGDPERAHCLCLSSDSGSWSGTAVSYFGPVYTQQRPFSETPPTFSLRKEVIQPQVLLRLPCYDFTPIMNHTLGRCSPCGSARRLLVQSTFVM
jgi:hypothetical protein